MRTRRLVVLPLLVPLASCLSTGGARHDQSLGLAVREVAEGGAAAAAGLRPGDVLLTWQSEDASGELESPFDVMRLQVEHASVGPVTVNGRRDRDALALRLPAGKLGVTTWPILGGEQDQQLGEAMATEGEQRTGRLEELARREVRAGVRAWLLMEAAKTAGEPRAEELWQQAASATVGDSTARAWLPQRHGDTLMASGRPDAAAPEYTRALESVPAGGLSAATLLGDLGIAQSWLGDLDGAERSFREALQISQDLAPGSLDEARSLGNFGVLSVDRGDLVAAERSYRQALDIFEKVQPGRVEVARTLENLGVVAGRRGESGLAEELLRRALEAYQRLDPGGRDVATTLNNLGTVLEQRNDLEAAEAHYRQALEIHERLAPDSQGVAAGLSNLGNVLRSTGDAKGAEELFRRALELEERLAPGSPEVAGDLGNLGNLAFDRGDFAAAEDWYRRALDIFERQAPGSLSVAHAVQLLADVACRRGELEAAEKGSRQALAIRQRLAPGSSEVADSLHGLGDVLLAGGRREEAIDAFAQAVRALEEQQQRLGGSPEQLGEFRSKHLDVYRKLIDLLVEAGRVGEAFDVLEAARARALLALLAERDIVTADVPAELERERRSAIADSERILGELGALTSDDSEERSRLLSSLDEVRLRQEDVRARIRSASPRLAELRYPQPLQAAAVQNLLEPGVLLLSYSLGEQTSRLFAVSREELTAFTLDISEKALRHKVQKLRSALQGTESAGSAGDVRRLTSELTAMLLRPAVDAIGRAERLVIVPDGALYLLPFAALRDPAADDVYLVEKHALSLVPSATVLGELRKRPKADHPFRLEAFGDPELGTPESAPARLRQLLRSGTALSPLPGTRAEVAALAGLYGDSASVWLGREATEERARAAGPEASILHFACHGLVDERFPLESALALTPPEQRTDEGDNGYLQAWEVFEQVRVDADLVTLSACDTALGEELAGEGIVGLARAFQYAGARTVLASLWSISDESTAALMLKFYTGLAAGLPKDEALRQAQCELLRSPLTVERDGQTVEVDASAPFHWAAFQLIGDWR